MRIVFCDDDERIRRQLMDYVREFFELKDLEQPEYADYSDGQELLDKESKVDIAFLDVEMPGISGVQTGAKLMERSPGTKVFIVTSYPDYLDEAMKYRVFRFLSKPVDRERLFRNLQDALYQHSLETVTVPIETADEIISCSADEIICLEAKNRQTAVYTTGRNFLSVKGIEYWQKLLELPSMYSPYRSFIINMKYVRSFDRTVITLSHGSKELRAYIARRKYKDFKSRYLLFMESTR